MLRFTNLDWLGSIPERWQVVKLRQILRPFSEKNRPDLPLLSVVREKGVIVRNVDDKDENHNYVPEDLSGYKHVRRGQFAMNKMKAWQGSYGVSKYDGIVSPAYFVFDINFDINREFFNTAIRSKAYVSYFGQASDGIRVGQWDLSMQRMKEIPFLVPPREEQEQIVRFLEWKVSAINRLIAKLKKKLTLLQELVNKQFQIVSANSSQKMKIKHIAYLYADFIDVKSDCYYMKTGMYNRGRGIFRREALLGSDMGDSLFQRIHSDCVMISGQFAWEAAVYITTVEDEIGVASHRYYLLKPSGIVPSEYIWCFLMSEYGQMQMKLCSHGAAGRNRPLNIKELLNVYIPLPALNTNLKNLTNNVHLLMKMRELIKKQEKMLADFCSRLISDVVTGKIDVRGIDVPEYEFVGEDMAADEGDEVAESVVAKNATTDD